MKFHIFHKWNVVNDNGFTKYRECKKCKLREVSQQSIGYQPIDWDWVKGFKEAFTGFNPLIELRLRHWQRINLQEV